MKKIFLLLSFVLASLAIIAQPSTMGTTNKPIKGTFFKDGKVHLSPGYKVVLSTDGKTGTVRKDNEDGGGEVSGTFRCASVGECKTCKLGVVGNSLYCVGTDCECLLIVSVPANSSGASSTSGDRDGKLTWKRLEIPKSTTRPTSN